MKNAHIAIYLTGAIAGTDKPLQAVGYFESSKAIMSFPGHLNGGKIPELSEVKGILAGDTIALGPYCVEFLQGIVARKNKQARNPYPHGSIASQLWINGFNLKGEHPFLIDHAGFKTYMIVIKHKETSVKTPVPVWAESEAIACKAIEDSYGTNYTIVTIEVRPYRYMSGISCD